MADTTKNVLEELGFVFHTVSLETRTSSSYVHPELPFSIFLAADSHSWGESVAMFSKLCPDEGRTQYGRAGVIRITLHHVRGPVTKEQVLPVYRALSWLYPRAVILFDGFEYASSAKPIPSDLTR